LERGGEKGARNPRISKKEKRDARIPGNRRLVPSRERCFLCPQLKGKKKENVYMPSTS